jgi:hypothetical protein
MIQTDRYGLHWAPGDIAFLLQQDGATNLISPELPCPFAPPVVRPPKFSCPHAIDLQNTAPAPEWISDPLAQVMLPTPKPAGEKPKVIYDPDGRHETLIWELTRLASPAEPVMRPVWWASVHSLRRLYYLTDLGPLVWSRATSTQTQWLYRHAEMALTYRRRILVVAVERLPLFGEFEWIDTNLSLADVASAPLEAIGAGLLKEHMQRAEVA